MSTKKKILLVDDEEGLGRLVKLNLEETGHYEVRTETKGTQAHLAAREFQPDLILLDVIMPDAKGPEVAREIQADKSLQDTPIVLFTAAMLKETRGDAQRKAMGSFPLIEKPVNTAELIHHIEKALVKKALDPKR